MFVHVPGDLVLEQGGVFGQDQSFWWQSSRDGGRIRGLHLRSSFSWHETWHAGVPHQLQLSLAHHDAAARLQPTNGILTTNQECHRARKKYRRESSGNLMRFITFRKDKKNCFHR